MRPKNETSRHSSHKVRNKRLQTSPRASNKESGHSCPDISSKPSSAACSLFFAVNFRLFRKSGLLVKVVSQ
jgi:hypothetical protein